MSKEIKLKIKSLGEKLKESKSVCLISHIHPDGDSIGSLLGFGLALRQIEGLEVKFAYVDDIPSNFSFLPGIENIKKVGRDEYFDMIITLDCSDIERLGEMKTILESADTIVNIDHHVSNLDYGDLNIVLPKASSTGEIIYKILEYLGLNVTKEIATCLYVAISTDTGSFKYESTSAYTHIVASRLLEKGIDLNKINVELYQSTSLNKANLLIKALNTLEFYENKKVAVVYISRNMLEDCKATIHDTNGIVEFIRNISTVEVACVLKEIANNEIKVGLRSKRYVDVADIAKRFNGGGHVRASGCTIFKSIEEAKHDILEEILKDIR
ncbi:DHH family phosphoesterase [Caldisalinibacter kiritimatiensis]|uniref:3'-to-5' oligoribonuclease A n=1 Tax=Caldisalinibacter kiritimatiensis TaxID=1304284 RepID=R1CEA5_9FIRM|nr:bifunctional oligoribonuclease/PAP phosphatase NrnA [Caldisalinibacter kiritimatiensis]EOD00625.1 3'-to-5' oligoribonuclease A [Caldisalinibacter kiritimatiensis]